MVPFLMTSVGDLLSGLFSSALLESQVATNPVDHCCSLPGGEVKADYTVDHIKGVARIHELSGKFPVQCDQKTRLLWALVLSMLLLG